MFEKLNEKADTKGLKTVYAAFCDKMVHTSGCLMI